MRFGGMILKESLEDQQVLDRLQIASVEFWVPEKVADFQPQRWTAIYFEGEAADADAVAAALAQAMNRRWYGNVTTEAHSYVIFQDRVFKYPRGAAAERSEAQAYARDQGVPPWQIEWGEEMIVAPEVEGEALAVLILGSPSDRSFAQGIVEGLDRFGVPSVVRIASAHKSPQRLVQMLEAYELDPRPKVYITVAGRSNALSGLVDAQVAAPVIACPPYSDKFAGGDLLSSLRVPSGVAPAVVLAPAGAALLAAKILAVRDPGLRARVEESQEAQRQRLLAADAASLAAGPGASSE